jgi:hypothetical protein
MSIIVQIGFIVFVISVGWLLLKFIPSKATNEVIE